MSYTNPHSEEFLEQVKRYRKRVLTPAGLDFSAEVRRHATYFPKNAVFEGEERVWKFYGPERNRNARNTVRTSKRLIAEGISTPKLHFTDVRFETVRQHGVACVIMDRIQGEPFDTNQLKQAGCPLAPLLARMHRLTSNAWGDLTWQTSGRGPAHFIKRTAAEILNHVQPLTSRAPHGPLEDFIPRLARHLKRWDTPNGLYQLVHGDIHERNILQTADGILHFIDLDFSGYRLFSFDIADLIQRINAGPVEFTDPEVALEHWESRARPFLEDYFVAVPDGFREQWRELRHVGFLLVTLRKYLESLRLASPEDCREQGIRIEDLLRDLNARRRLLENLIQVL